MNTKSFSTGLLGLLIGSIISFYLFSNVDEKISFEGWTAIYKHDKEGNALQGSKQNLMEAIRNGFDIRVGWGWKSEERGHSIEHIATPIWIGILDESEVISHLDPQVLSRINWDETNASYADSTLLDLEWRVVLSTKGTFDAVWYNRKTQEIHRRVPQAYTLTWFVDYPKGRKVSQTELFSDQPVLIEPTR